ncbi:VOC family protein [Rhodococcus sp. IEGM 1408]|uniref:VOC family protein n=1 Tax=Rhodococcus sp. IEGM 1408 TaxID=3082220 RepID=UPI002955685D|nr:VOC family protein [Rhodococcus sp. IEGM 1408]MDV8002568.1 VOC family protein [Rhodococcus sp. IEGM 1408]
MTDESAAGKWYARLLDREPDDRPMPGLLEWHFGNGFGLQVWAEPERAGHSVVVIEVDDMDAVVSRLTAAGFTLQGPQPGGGRRILVIEDPDGNRVVFAGE